MGSSDWSLKESNHLILTKEYYTYGNGTLVLFKVILLGTYTLVLASLQLFRQFKKNLNLSSVTLVTFSRILDLINGFKSLPFKQQLYFGGKDRNCQELRDLDNAYDHPSPKRQEKTLSMMVIWYTSSCSGILLLIE